MCREEKMLIGASMGSEGQGMRAPALRAGSGAVVKPCCLAVSPVTR